MWRPTADNYASLDSGPPPTAGPMNVPAGFAMLADGSWSLDASHADYQHLAAGATADVIVNYTVTDEHGATDTATLTITVTGNNDPPVGPDPVGSGNEDNPANTREAAGYGDGCEDGASLTYAP